jgi:precorrin-6Y C5,15-methyltransferase (decarboxylating)
MSAPWLSLIGIGEDGLDGLSSAARDRLTQARLIVGGARHLAMLGVTTAETLSWASPLTDTIPAILARRGEPVAVLASGDPFHYGVGTTLIAHVPVAEIEALPHLSAFALAANRLGWAQQSTVTISLHGRALERIIPHLQPGARLLALSWDGATPEALARLLTARGLGGSALTVCEAMGGARERIRSCVAANFDLTDIDPLNTIALEVAPETSRCLPLTPGLRDDWFEHDGQITKREVRAVTLAALSPRCGEALIDIGSGSGSIAIEWMLTHPDNRAIAIEPRRDRAERIGRNAKALGVPDLRVIEGKAPAALDGLTMADAIFIGGGATSPGLLERVLELLKPQGRLVANAVTLETQGLFLDWRKQLGGELIEIAVSEAEMIGGFTGWKPARPIVQWRWEKLGRWENRP